VIGYSSSSKPPPLLVPGKPMPMIARQQNLPDCKHLYPARPFLHDKLPLMYASFFLFGNASSPIHSRSIATYYAALSTNHRQLLP
jgi:hypothetical protein